MDNQIAPYLDLINKELPSNTDATINASNLLLLKRITCQLKAKSILQQNTENESLAFFDSILDDIILQLQSLTSLQALMAELILHIRLQPNYKAALPLIQSALALIYNQPTPLSLEINQKISSFLLSQEALIAQKFDELFKYQDTIESSYSLSSSEKESLQAFLRNQFPSENSLVISNIHALVGGGSKLTLKIDLEQTHTLPASVVLRMDKSSGIVDSSVINEFKIIQLVSASGIPVPEPLAICEDTTLLGAPFIIMGHVLGHNIGDPIEVNEPSHSLGLELAKTMATLHQIPATQFDGIVSNSSSSITQRVLNDITEFERAWRTLGSPSIALEQSYRWLKEHIQFSEGSRSLIHCDIGAHNFLVEQGKLSALLDWETALIGNPAQDLAYAKTMIIQMMSWEEFILEYENSGGLVPSQEEMDFYLLWSAVWRTHYTLVSNSVLQAGMSKDLIVAYAAQHIDQKTSHDVHFMINKVLDQYGI